MRIFRFVPVVLLTVLVPIASAEPFLRGPAIHGDLVVFSAESDIWVADINSGQARRITTHAGHESDPRFSPDGNVIAFVGEYDGGPDLYTVGIHGGAPVRLTWDSHNSIRPVGWTRDGKGIVFRSERLNGEWHSRLWSVPAAGGLPTLLPIPRVEHAALDESGQNVAFVPISAEWQHWRHYRGGQSDDVWLANLQNGTFRQLTSDPAIDTTPLWVANALYIVSDRSGTANLYRLNLDDGSATAVTRFDDYDARYPSTDGRRVVFEHGNGISLYDPSTGEVKTLPIRLTSDRIHARPRRIAATDQLQSASLGPTGKRVLVEARGQILTLPVGQGDWRVVEATAGARAQYPSWSRDGKWIAFVSDRSGEEQVWVSPVSGAAPARQVTKDHQGPLGRIVWSPDGRRVLTSDREMRILLVDVTTGATTVVAQGDRGGSYDETNESYRFSPDGKWLTWAMIGSGWNRTIWLYDVEKQKSTQLTSATMDSWSPEFDPSGKYLYFISARDLRPSYSPTTNTYGYDKTARVSVIALASDTKSPFLKLEEEEGIKPPAAEASGAKKSDSPEAAKLPAVKVDIDGIADRIADVPVSGDRYVAVVPMEERILLAVETEPAGQGGDPNKPRFQLKSLSLKDQRKYDLTTVAEKMTSFVLSADQKKLLLRTGNDLMVAASDAAPVKDGDAITLGQVLLGVDPEAEWKQMFHESWRIARDFFYDPNMHGVDWAAVKKKYETQLPNLGARSELNIILGNMMAELNVGHAYIFGGDMARTTPLAAGRIGADLQPDAGGKAWKIARILPGDPFDLENRSPLLAPGVNVKAGQFIVSVAGQPVSTTKPIEAMLVGMADRLVPLGVSATPDGPARTVLVRPLASESRLRYYDWVEGRRQYVRSHGGEKIVYVHMPNMGQRGLQEFTKQYYPNLELSDGTIIDVRNNGGGNISAHLLAQIADRPRVWFKPRYGASWSRVSWATPGYRVAMCDDQSYSNAEEFCDAFQRMRVGPVIGSRSWGGEVGSGLGYPLLDGGKIFVPNYAAWSPKDGWIIEGHGVVPDFEVQQDPQSLLAGRDPQLDRAIAWINEQVKVKPVVHATPPPYPRRVGATTQP